jgi:hypothetical protein
MSIVFWSISSRWSVKIIDENAFCKVKLQRISVKLSYLSTTENTEHTETILAPVMPCFRGFGVFRGSLLFGGKSDYVVAAPQWNHFLSLPRIGSYSRSVKFVSSSPLVKSPTTIIKSSSIRK